jgi:hypothetical protein
MNGRHVILIGHPCGILTTTEQEAKKYVNQGRCRAIEGILYWIRSPRRGEAEPRSVFTHLDRYDGQMTAGEWRPRQSGEAGPMVMQMEQGI